MVKMSRLIFVALGLFFIASFPVKAQDPAAANRAACDEKQAKFKKDSCNFSDSSFDKIKCTQDCKDYLNGVLPDKDCQIVLKDILRVETVQIYDKLCGTNLAPIWRGGSSAAATTTTPAAGAGAGAATTMPSAPVAVPTAPKSGVTEISKWGAFFLGVMLVW